MFVRFFAYLFIFHLFLRSFLLFLSVFLEIYVFICLFVCLFVCVWDGLGALSQFQPASRTGQTWGSGLGPCSAQAHKHVPTSWQGRPRNQHKHALLNLESHELVRPARIRAEESTRAGIRARRRDSQRGNPKGSSRTDLPLQY